MSTIKHPVGPQDPSVYRRRRLIVLLGIVAVIIIVVLIIVRPGAGGDAAPVGQGSNAPSAGATGGPVPSDQPVASDGAPCAPGQVTVKAITDANDYSDSEVPKLSLSLTNTGSTSCTMNAGTSQQLYVIKSGKDVYWQSTDCQTGASDQDVLLKAGETLTSAPIEWDRTRSAKDTCKVQDRTPAPADGASYYLTTEVAGIQSESAKQFLLK